MEAMAERHSALQVGHIVCGGNLHTKISGTLQDRALSQSTPRFPIPQHGLRQVPLKLCASSPCVSAPACRAQDAEEELLYHKKRVGGIQDSRSPYERVYRSTVFLSCVSAWMPHDVARRQGVGWGTVHFASLPRVQILILNRRTPKDESRTAGWSLGNLYVVIIMYHAGG